MSEIKYRTIPLDDDFMKEQRIHDKIWGYLQSISYVTKGEEKIRFCYKTNEITASGIHRAIAKEIGRTKSNNIKYDITIPTIRTALSLYKKIGLITDGYINDLYNRKVEVIVLSQDFKKFVYIPLDTLKFLVDTSNENTIKIYSFLLDKYNWKLKGGERYNFNLAEISEAIGYYPTSAHTSMIRNILISLSNNNLISYYETYFIKDGHPPIPMFILNHVSTKCPTSLSVGG